jgi:hypothetical protein
VSDQPTNGQPRPDSLRADERELALQQRRLAHDRVRVIGLLVIVILILLLTFFRFGASIPWSAR